MATSKHHARVLEVAAAAVVSEGGDRINFPQHLLKDMSDILDDRPHDTLFKLIPQPGKGFGKVECLEAVCAKKKKIIELDECSGLEDGGLACGIGSLHLLAHHQKESPAHRRAVKARLEAGKPAHTSPARSSVRAPVALSSKAGPNRTLCPSQKLTLIEISDGEDKPVRLPSSQRSSNAVSSGSTAKASHAPVGLPGASFSATKHAHDKADKGKGRAPLQKHSSRSCIEENKFSAKIDFTSNTAVPIALRAGDRASRVIELDSDSEDFSRSNRSSADSDLVDLSSRFGTSTQPRKSAHELTQENSQNDKSEIMNTAYMRKRLAPNGDSMSPPSTRGPSSNTMQEPSKHDVKPVAQDSPPHGTSQRILHGMRDVALPQNRNPAAEPAGDDSGYLTSVTGRNGDPSLMLEQPSSASTSPSRSTSLGARLAALRDPRLPGPSQPSETLLNDYETQMSAAKLEMRTLSAATRHASRLSATDRDLMIRAYIEQENKVRELQISIDQLKAGTRTSPVLKHVPASSSVKAPASSETSHATNPAATSGMPGTFTPAAGAQVGVPAGKLPTARAPAPYAFVHGASATPAISGTSNPHTAALGPTFVPNAQGGNAAVRCGDMFGNAAVRSGDMSEGSDGEDDPADIDENMPDFRNDLEDFTGGRRTYTEAETLNYFDDAAAGYDFNADGEAALRKAMDTIGLENQGDTIAGTNIQPFAHQILGIAWMLDQERVKKRIKAGILADDMGLGKTVQTIALIHLHRAPKEDKNTATLVIAPLALLEQWRSEIITHSGGKMRVHIYHQQGRNISKKALQKFDVVLTTNATMSLAWNMCDSIARAKAKRAAKKWGHEWTEEEEADWAEDASQQNDPLFRINWRRVVIDEAQNIRNRDTRVSRASLYLKAEYRWCLTGTPVTNTLTDIYSLLRFLKVKPWCNWKRWRNEIYLLEKKNPEKASKRVQLILKLVLLRRNKDSELNGKRLLNLKPMFLNNHPVFPSEDERNVYAYIEGKSQQQLGKYIKEGTVMKNYAHILVLLLRLRQCVGHPALVTESYLNSAYTDPEAVEAERVASHNSVLSKSGRDALDAMLKRRLDFAKQRFEDEQAGRPLQLEECPICMEPLDASALITTCGHVFCGCIRTWMEAPESAAQNPQDFEEDDRACPTCRQKITSATLFEMKYFEPRAEQIAAITGGEVRNEQADFDKEIADYLRSKNMRAIAEKDKKSNKRKGRTSSGTSRAAKRRIIKDSDDDDDFIDDSEDLHPVAGYTKKTGGESESDEIESESDGDLDSASEESDSDREDIRHFLKGSKGQSKAPQLSSGIREKFSVKRGRQFLPSAKMEAMVKIIRESPKEDKIMVLSQWTSLLDLVAAYLNELAIPWITFRGDMKREDRDAAVKRFNESKKVKCLLMSLKAGGVGLNMTGGNRAILLDLAWSPAVEMQAFSRLHRLGQKKEVFVERCVVAGTVEDRILTLQAHKQKLADHSLGEGTGERMTKFGLQELKMLFGMGEEQGHFARQMIQANPLQAGHAGLPPVAGPSNS